jgi:glycosyltransferase involved in cell wall biosynthesis
VKTGPRDLSVVQVNFAFDNDLTDPDALLDRYATLTGWAEAIAAAGARRSAVVQRFPRRATIRRSGIEYVFTDRAIGAAVGALQPDVVHVNGLIFPVRTWALRRVLARPVAIVAQNHSDTAAMGRAPLLRFLGRATRDAVDAFLFAAPAHVERWRRAGFVAPTHQTHVVMEASTRLRPVPCGDARARTGVSGSPALVWIGRLNDNKDPLTVLDAFEMYALTSPDATMTMVFGTSGLVDAVRDRVARSPTLRDRVRLVGSVPHEEIAVYLSAADLFIVGSHHEGSGYALIEALACGATPVVTRIPSFRLLTRDGEVGALWPPGDASGCADAIQTAAGRARDVPRERIVDYFERHFSWAAIGRRAIAIYAGVRESVIHSRGGET